MASHVSTADMPHSDRFAYWSEVVSRTYAPVEAKQVGGGSFHGAVSVSDLGPVRVTRIGSVPMRYERGRGIVASNPSDNFFVGLTINGRTGLDQNGRQSEQGVGQIVAYDSGRPFTNHFPEAYDQIVLVVSRSQLMARLPDIDRLTGLTLPCTTHPGRVARGMVEELGCYDETLPQAAATQMAACLLDVLTLAMQVELKDQQAADDYGSARLDGIKRYIHDNLEDAHLDVLKIARNNAVSVRTLHRLFAANGDAVKHWLYQQRLHAAFRALSEQRFKQVTDAAMTYGFADASHFARSFKKAFGVQPSTLLRYASTGAPHPPMRPVPGGA